jgi:hypothetical protein
MLPDLQAVSSWGCQLPLPVANDGVWCEHSDGETHCRLKFWLDIEQTARYECSLLEFSVPWGFFCDAGLS